MTCSCLSGFSIFNGLLWHYQRLRDSGFFSPAIFKQAARLTSKSNTLIPWAFEPEKLCEGAPVLRVLFTFYFIGRG
jgi:hypothetical protein